MQYHNILPVIYKVVPSRRTTIFLLSPKKRLKPGDNLSLPIQGSGNPTTLSPAPVSLSEALPELSAFLLAPTTGLLAPTTPPWGEISEHLPLRQSPPFPAFTPSPYSVGIKMTKSRSFRIGPKASPSHKRVAVAYLNSSISNRLGSKKQNNKQISNQKNK